MQALTQYIDSDSRGCPDMNNLRSAILASIYVLARGSARDASLSLSDPRRIALFIRQNRMAFAVADRDINAKTIQYMILCLMRYGLIVKVADGTYRVGQQHDTHVGCILNGMEFNVLDDTPVGESIDDVLEKIRTRETQDSITMLQSVYFGVAPREPVTECEAASQDTCTVVESPAAEVKVEVKTETKPVGRGYCVIC